MEENNPGQQAYINSESEKKKNPFKLILFFLIPLLLLGAAILPFYILTGGKQFDPAVLMFWQKPTPKPSPSQDTVSSPVWKSSEELIKEGSLEAPKKMLSISLTYNKKASPSLDITNLQIKNGYTPRSEGKGTYRMQLIDQTGQSLANLLFSVPDEVVVREQLAEGSSSEESKLVTVKLDKTDFVLDLPYSPQVAKVRLLTPGGSLVTEKDLKAVSTVNNEIRFYTIPKEQPNQQRGFLDFLISPVLAQGAAPLKIVFIGSGYTDSYQNVYNEVMKYFSDLFTPQQNEVVKNNPGKFEIQTVPFQSNRDFNCQLDRERKLQCDEGLVKQFTDQSADLIVVLSRNAIDDYKVQPERTFIPRIPGPSLFYFELKGSTPNKGSKEFMKYINQWSKYRVN